MKEGERLLEVLELYDPCLRREGTGVWNDDVLLEVPNEALPSRWDISSTDYSKRRSILKMYNVNFKYLSFRFFFV